MRSSSAPRLPVLLLALSLAGCAAGVRHGPATDPAGATADAGASAAAPAAPPRRPAVAPAGEAGGSPAPGRLDPSEQISPEELASIPDPVPGARETADSAPGAPSGTNSALKGSPSEPMDSVAPAPSEAPSEATEAGGPGANAGWVWRVQIFASENSGEAERVAREAETRLGTSALVAVEGALYKVRLGRFATEGEAQSLRERAVRAGYAGAFRTKTH